LFLHSISLSGFRNLSAGSYEFSSRVSSIYGRNGQGKTSFLEAIYLLAHSKSFRTSKNRELIAWSAARGSAEIEARITTQNGEQKLRVALLPRSREVWLNDKKVDSVLGFYGQVRVVIFTPEELQLVKGPPQQRRHFIDRTLAMVDPLFVKNALHYQRALKNRNALLTAKERRPGELPIWDRLLIEHGRVLAEKRRDFSGYIDTETRRLYADISKGSVVDEKVEVCYESNFLRENGELKDAGELEVEYGENIERDFKRGSTSIGVHRDDLQLGLDTGEGFHDARSSASQGQARTFALALKLASLSFLRKHSEEDPILLLDDVESELDEPRRHALYKSLKNSRSQVFLSGTQALLGTELGSSDLSFYEMRNGFLDALSGPKNTA